MAKNYTLQKQLYTELDFDDMTWHDNTLHAISFGEDSQFLLDIDYIFEWVHPTGSGRHFKYWIAPCTLIFENVSKLTLNMEVSAEHHRKIDEIDREPVTDLAVPTNQETTFDWFIDTLQGQITFKATGYKQYVRQQPTLVNNDGLDIATRGGVSFGTILV